MWLTVIYILNEIILVASALMNITGLICLWNLKQSYTNQRILLVSYSSSELQFAVLKICTLVMLQTVGEESIYRIIFEAMYRAAIFVYFLTMILLLGDRFLACIYPMHYKVWFSKKEAIAFSALAWITGLLTATTCPIVGIKEFQVIAKRANLGFSVFILLASSFIYAAIGFKLRYRPMHSNRNASTGRFTKISFLIVGTFLVFIAIPEISIIIFKNNEKDLLTSVWVRVVYLVGNINYCIDPLIYVFGYQPVKGVFIQKISKLCPCYSQVSTVGVADRTQIVSKMATTTKRDINI